MGSARLFRMILGPSPGVCLAVFAGSAAGPCLTARPAPGKPALPGRGLRCCHEPPVPPSCPEETTWLTSQKGPSALCGRWLAVHNGGDEAAGWEMPAVRAWRGSLLPSLEARQRGPAAPSTSKAPKQVTSHSRPASSATLPSTSSERFPTTRSSSRTSRSITSRFNSRTRIGTPVSR